MTWNEGADQGPSDWDNSGAQENTAWNGGDSGDKTNEYNNDNMAGDGFDSGFAGLAIADDGGAGGPKEGACRRCGEEGHFARDCEQPAKLGACFNCGEEGHNKADCPKPRKPSGPCRICNNEGHQAADCESRVCKNCAGVGHDALGCKQRRMLRMQHIADKVPAEAWEALEEASANREISDFKDAVQVLVKACPDMTYPQLEKEFRKRNFNVYLIALEKNHGDTLTVVNLQGDLDKNYVVSYFLSDKPQRPNLKERWPASAEENLKRLEDAGIPMDRGVPKCTNCNELGHTSRSCKQEKQEIDRPKVSCAICGNDGHRARDCQDRPPPKGRECRVCQKTDHMAKDCPDRQKFVCRNCGSEDHKAAECDQPRVIRCRNCDVEGHTSKECTAPKDWSRVKCNNCGEMGHTVKRCSQPIKDEGPTDHGIKSSNTFDSHERGEVGSGDNEWENDNFSQSAVEPLPAYGNGW